MPDPERPKATPETPQADTKSGPDAKTEPNEAQEAAAGAATDAPVGTVPPEPRIAVNAQYIKDLSFENPGAPQSLVATTERPNIEVSVEVKARPLGRESHEVMLRVRADAKRSGDLAFILDLTYAGVFTITGAPAQALEPLLLIECPRLLFPFARRVIADQTRDGGFPPLLVEPLDFASLYRRRAQESPRDAGS